MADSIERRGHVAMMNSIVRVSAAKVSAELPAPIVFGNWVMNTREYAVVQVVTRGGIAGWSFALTRDGAAVEQVRTYLAKAYRGTNVADAGATYNLVRSSSWPSYASGIGLRALSLVDLAVWDAYARCEELTIAELLGGSLHPMPTTAIVSYPPGVMGPEETRSQVEELVQSGWRRFKLAVSPTEDQSEARLRAARAAAPTSWLGCDGAWTYSDAEVAAEFLNRLADIDLGWFEDVFPPGDANRVATLRSLTNTPIAMGDEQGGSYFPQALLNCRAVDVVRFDVTCMGGISATRSLIEHCLAQGVAVAPHMYAHVHSQILSAWGLTDLPIEWGVPWTGVDPYADSLEQPALLETGHMRPLQRSPGFGDLVNFEWVDKQQVFDPDHILRA